MPTWTKEVVDLSVAGNSLTIDDIKIDGATIGHTDDTDLLTLANGSLTIAGSLTTTGQITSSALLTAAQIISNGAASITGLLTATSGVKLGNNIIYAADGGSTITLTNDDNVTILGDLTVTGGRITFGNGEIIHNESDNKVIMTEIAELDLFGNDDCKIILRAKETTKDAGFILYRDDGLGLPAWSICNDGNYSDWLRFDANTATVGGNNALMLSQDGHAILQGDLTVTGGNITVTGAPSYTATTQTARNADSASTAGALQDVVQTLIDDLQDIGILG